MFAQRLGLAVGISGMNTCLCYFLWKIYLLFSTSGLAESYDGRHSLVIHITFAPNHDYMPAYSSFGMLDDFKVFHYDSRRSDFNSPFREQASLSTVWRDLHHCAAFKTDYLLRFLTMANATMGVNRPILQLMYGCTLDEEGEVKWVYQFTVNGKYTLSMDQGGEQWTSHHPQGKDIKAILDSFVLWNKSNKIYVQRDCVPRLKKFYAHGLTTIQRQVSPEVVIAPSREGPNELICLATGFYPSNISLEWLLNGKPVSLDVLSTDILPNHDLTYQIRKALPISDPEGNYTCRVEHSSLPEPLMIQWEGPKVMRSNRHTTLIAAVCMFIVVCLVMTVWKKLKL